MVASSMANILHMSGLLVVAALLLEVSAQLSIELGRIMQRHWEEHINNYLNPPTIWPLRIAV
jgi:hypothetical protein